MKRSVLVLLILVFAVNIASMDVYYRRKVAAQDAYEKVKNIRCPDLFDGLKIEIHDILQKGLLYYRLGDKRTSRTFFEQVIEECENFKSLIDVYPYVKRSQGEIDDVSKLVSELEYHTMVDFFADGWEEIVNHYEEARRSHKKGKMSLQELNHKAAPRRERFERIDQNLQKVKDLYRIYGAKVKLFFEIRALLNKVKNTIDDYNTNRDIARKPVDLHNIRKKHGQFWERYDHQLERARESIAYTSVDVLEGLKYSICYLSEELGQFQREFHRPIYEQRVDEQIGERILKDKWFSGFYPMEYQNFYTNYQKYLKWKKNSYSPQDLEIAQEYLSRALKHEQLFLNYTRLLEREEKLNHWLTAIDKDSQYSERTVKSFYFFGVRNSVLQAEEARRAGKLDEFIQALENAERNKERYEK